jgi:hypothetical protein
MPGENAARQCPPRGDARETDASTNASTAAAGITHVFEIKRAGVV